MNGVTSHITKGSGPNEALMGPFLEKGLAAPAVRVPTLLDASSESVGRLGQSTGVESTSR